MDFIGDRLQFLLKIQLFSQIVCNCRLALEYGAHDHPFLFPLLLVLVLMRP